MRDRRPDVGRGDDGTSRHARYEARLRSALRELDGKGVGRWQSRPLLFRVLRQAGLRVRPNYFGHPVRVLLVEVVWFAVVFGSVMWLSPFGASREPAELARTAMIAGIVLALVMALYRRFRVERLGLRRWRDIEVSDGGAEAGRNDRSAGVSAEVEDAAGRVRDDERIGE